MPQKPQNIDAYLATVSPDRRAALQKLRKTILSILPDAEECISYSMPAFRHAGRVIAGFLATSKGCSLVRKLLKVRIAETARRGGAKGE